MKLKWVTNPSSNKPDPMLTMSVLVVTAACVKFMLEGVTLQISGHELNFGHVDAMVYAALTGPVLSVHGYVKGKKTELETRLKVDNPDAN